MADTVYSYPPEIKKKIRAKKLELALKHHRRQISEAEALDQFWKFLESMARYRITDGGDNVHIVCSGCAKTHAIPRHVMYFACNCSPDVKRPTFLGDVA